MNRHLILVGLMGSGKSTIARMLRRRLQVPVYEIDTMIEQMADKTIPEVFSQDGEEAFRKIEREAVLGLIGLPPGIVSTGGGTFVSEANQKVLLECGWVFYLHGSPPELANRIQSTASRPLLQGRDKEEVLRELYVARDPRYQQAHVVVSTDQRSSHDVMTEVCGIYCQKESIGLRTED